MYDFDRDQVSLGINIHSKDKVSMYKPGGRPADLVKTETEAQNMEPAAEAPAAAKTEAPDATTATQTDATTEETPSSWKDRKNMGHFIKLLILHKN